MCLVPALLEHGSVQTWCLCVDELSPFSVVTASRQVLVPEQHVLSRKKILFRKMSSTHALRMVQFFKVFPLSSTALSLKSKLTSIIILEDQLWFNFFWSNLALQTLFQKSKVRKRMFTQRSYSGTVVTEQLASLVRKDSLYEQPLPEVS